MARKAVRWGDVLAAARQFHDQHGRGDGGGPRGAGGSCARRREGQGRDRPAMGDPANRDAGMNAALILVRHGRPVIDPDQPPTTWPLCPEGREAVAKLAEKLAAYAPAAVISSPEPKAL